MKLLITSRRTRREPPLEAVPPKLAGALWCQFCFARNTCRRVVIDGVRVPKCGVCAKRPIADGRATYLPAKGAS